MSLFATSPLSPAVRLLCAAAALCTIGATAAAMLASWEHQADPRWLDATAVLAEAAACDGEATRAERNLCKQGILATRTPTPAREYPVASR